MKFSIIKREPSYFFNNIHEDLNRFLKDTFGDIEAIEKSSFPQIERVFRPAIEIKETKNEYKIKVELPGVKKEDIDAELYENGIVLKAQCECEKIENDENLHTSEFRYGKMVRSIPLEHSINLDKAKSEFKNGILKINLEKMEQQKEEVKKLTIN